MSNYDPEIFKFLDVHFLGNGIGAGYNRHSKFFEKYEMGNGCGCGGEGLIIGDGRAEDVLVKEIIPYRDGNGYGDGGNPSAGIIPEIVFAQLDEFVTWSVEQEMKK